MRIREAANEARGLEAVEAVGHRAAGEAEVGGELAGRGAVGRSDPAELAEEGEGPPVELELLERLVHPEADVVVQDPDPLDDPPR